MPIEALRVTRDERESPDKRQEILDVAASFFLSYGYEGSSVNSMARHSGISKESFYRYFRGKEELFTAVLERELAQYKRNITQLNEHWDEEDMRESLVRAAQTLLSVILTDRQQALRKLVFSQVPHDPEIGLHYFAIGPALAYDSLEQFFSLHQAETEFPAPWLAHAFVSLLLHEPMLARNCGVRDNPDPGEIPALAATGVDYFLKAFFNSERT